MNFCAPNGNFRFLEIFAIVNPIVNYICAALKQFLFNNSEILAKHSLGIDTSFATMSDQPTQNWGFFVQASAGGVLPGGGGGPGIQGGGEAGMQRGGKLECSSVEREQCWLGPVGREVSLIKWLLSTVQEK